MYDNSLYYKYVTMIIPLLFLYRFYYLLYFLFTYVKLFNYFVNIKLLVSMRAYPLFLFFLTNVLCIILLIDKCFLKCLSSKFKRITLNYKILWVVWVNLKTTLRTNRYSVGAQWYISCKPNKTFLIISHWNLYQ